MLGSGFLTPFILGSLVSPSSLIKRVHLVKVSSSWNDQHEGMVSRIYHRPPVTWKTKGALLTRAFLITLAYRLRMSKKSRQAAAMSLQAWDKCTSIKTGWPPACPLAKEITCENFKMISFATLVFLMFAHFLIHGR